MLRVVQKIGRFWSFLASQGCSLAARRLVLAAMLVCVSESVNANDYRVMPGDTLRMRIIGLPELQSEAVVTRDGSVDLPLVGSVQSKGLTTDQIETELARRLLSVSYTTIGSNEITRQVDLAGFRPFVEVARFRPIFLDGLIGNPGQVDFQHGLSVRAAIVRSGGVRIAGTIDASGAVIAQNYGETQIRAINVAVLQAKRWRLEALAMRDADLPFPRLEQGITAPDAFQELLTAEKSYARSELEKYELRRLTMLHEIADKDVLLDLYADLVTAGEKVQKENSATVERMTTLEERGMVRRNDLENAMRLLEISRADNLENRIDKLTVEQAVQNLRREIKEIENDFDRDIAVELATAAADLLLARTGLQTSLLLSGAASGLTTQPGALQMNISVFRDGDTLVVGTDINLDSFVAPGDIISIAR
ncbi:polysaccharide biosynthesis/export family protein [Roseovarius sp. M141]|uniref:polysaccharide biosynthesis/export family protein n=1 Tax=Roseovarius sp. M141 TaxID=2583806 RepID=UPI0020CE66CD|nr:polysaccharide biosynthesis/export family protein [Roseovarius sp. M141]